MIDHLSRHQAGDHQKAERLQQERRSNAEDTRTRQSDERSVNTPQEQQVQRKRAQEQVHSSKQSSNANFYRFRDTSDFPSRTQRALNTYQSNQEAEDRRLPQGELVASIDTFA